MRICIIGDTGGVHVRNRALAVARSGHRVSVVSPRPSGLGDLDERIPEGPPGSLRWMIHHYRMVCGCPGDIIHIHYACSLGAWLLVLAGRRQPVVVSVMGGDVLFEEQGNLPLMARWMTRQVLSRANLITVKSDHLKGVLVCMGLAEEKLLKVIWGVDLEFFKPVPSEKARHELGLLPHHRVIFSPRILRPFYNHHMVIEAMPALLQQIPDARLIIGEYEAEPAYKARLLALSEELDIGHAVKFAGIIPHQRMPEYMSLAEAVVGIPPSDGLPQTLLEALACGTPNVVGRLDQYEEIIHPGEDALFVDLTAEAVSMALLKILKNPSLAARLGERGRQAARAHADMRQSVKQIDDAYGRLSRWREKPKRFFMARACIFLILGGFIVRNWVQAVFRIGELRKSP